MLTQQEISNFPDSFCMEIGVNRTGFFGKLKGNGHFRFPLRKLLGKCLFPKFPTERIGGNHTIFSSVDLNLNDHFSVFSTNQGQIQTRELKNCDYIDKNTPAIELQFEHEL